MKTKIAILVFVSILLASCAQKTPTRESQIDVSRIISLASLFVSLYVLWATRLARFRLDVASTSRVELTSNPLSTGAKGAGIKLQLLFTNKGANLGYVHDVAIAICKNGSESKEVIAFRSLFESLDETLDFTNQELPPKLGTFSSFPIRPSETIIKTIVFVSMDSDFKFEAGVYSLTPYTKSLKIKEKWHKWNTLEVEINSADIDILDQSTVISTTEGKRNVKWMRRLKPTKFAEEAFNDLLSQINRKK